MDVMLCPGTAPQDFGLRQLTSPSAPAKLNLCTDSRLLQSSTWRKGSLMLPVSRRQFLQGSALLAATAATAGLETITEAPLEAQQPGGANERINVAVIGVNGRGMSHVQA